jgi:hypothetical protein
VQYVGTKLALSRRAFVGRLAAGAAAACAAGIGTAQALTARQGSPGSANGDNRLPVMPQAPAVAPEGAPAEPHAATQASAPPSAPPPWELLRPLALGSVVARDWRVADLSGVADGSCVLTLRNERGRAQRIHLCGNDGSPQGLVYTQRFDLLVMNGGQGDLPTDEGLAQAVAAVAHVLAANEGDRQHEPLVTALLPQTERVRLLAATASLR